MTTETPAPPTNPCPQWCEVWEGGTTADLAGPPLSPELVQGITESVAQAQPADLDAMLGTTDPTPVIVGVLVALLVVLAAATVLVRRHRAAVTEGDVLHREAVEQVSAEGGDVPQVSVTDGDVS